jgi:hypothetical protein
MFEQPIVAQSSSLYPIDLTACLFQSVLYPASKIRVFFTDTFFYPNGPSRSFVARAALPLSEWEFTSSGAWQQRHLPLGTDCDIQIDLLLASVGESFVQTCPAVAKAIRDHVALLAAGYRSEQVVTGHFRQKWATTSARLLSTIFQQCGVRSATIESFGEQRDGDAQNNEAIGALLNLADRLEPDVRFRFLAGGTIEYLVSEIWHAFDLVEFSNGILRLGNTDSELLLDPRLDLTTTWRFRGSAELLLLRQSGILIDLPWYSRGHKFLDTDEGADGVEIISPLHFSDPQRSASRNRLIPTGYTLVEYDHPTVRSYVAAALGCDQVSSVDLNDVVRFIRVPSAGKQRLTKAQRSTRHYRNMLEQDWRRRLLSDNSPANEIRTMDVRPHRLRLGERLTLMHAIITLLKEHISGHIDLRCRSEIWSALLQARIIVSEGKLCLGRLLELLMLDQQDCIVQLSLQGRQLDLPDVNALELLAEPTALSQLRDRYQLLADEHYAWLGFMLAGPLKAHILSLFLLIGPKDIRNVIARIIEGRSRPTLPFALCPWERVPK